jgi:aralkylamine N-acetyltransferase
MPAFYFLTRPTSGQIQQIADLYRMEGWMEGGASGAEDLVAGIVAGSHCFLVAVSEDRIVGMGRAISDRISDAYIQDVAVLEPFRGAGIGTRIVSLLVERLHSDGLDWIGLIAERSSHPFYERLGFRRMPDSLPMLMKTP